MSANLQLPESLGSDPEPPSLDHVMAIVERRRTRRYRAVSGTIGLALVGGLTYVGATGRATVAIGPAASDPTSRSQPAPTAGITPEPTTITDPRAADSSCQSGNGPGGPAWLFDAADRTLSTGNVDQAIALASVWKVSLVEMKAMLDLLGTNLAGYSSRAGVTSAFGDEPIWSIEAVEELSLAWDVDAVTIKALALNDVEPALEALTNTEQAVEQAFCRE